MSTPNDPELRDVAIITRVVERVFREMIRMKDGMDERITQGK